MYRAYKGMFNGHLSHVAPTRKLGTDAKPFSKAPGLEGKFGETGLINLYLLDRDWETNVH